MAGTAQLTPSGGCFLPGNAVFSCSVDVPSSEAVKQRSTEYMQGYDKMAANPMYKQTSQDYGAMTPTPYTMPNTFMPKSQKFSNDLGLCGMYRNQSLNTATKKTKV